MTGTAASPRPPRLERRLAGEIDDRTAKALEKHLGLVTVGDLLEYYPRRWLSVRELTPIAELVEGELVTLVAEVVTVQSRQMRSRRGSLTEVVVTDGADRLHLAFFNQRAAERALRPGTRALFTGTVSRHRGRPQLIQPEYEEPPADPARGAGEESLMPVYPATARVSSSLVRRALQPVLDTLAPTDVPDPVPPALLARHRLPDRCIALGAIHRPRDRSELERARRRLRLEEALVLQCALVRRRRAVRARAAVVRRARPDGILAAFDERLPFQLTAGQQEVGLDIATDLASGAPMQRLLQGEVGSGKTLVALRAMLAVVDSGGQAALLAPTEVLAVQHHRSIQRMLGDLGCAGTLEADPRATAIRLVTGSLGAAARRRAMADVASGAAGLVVGTHALLSHPDAFADLALVVVDEQHRFGVEQRDLLRSEALRRDRTVPHLLAMTATPIPRTVAMTVFGDLDVSTLTQVPAGRSEVTTHVVAVGEHPSWLQRAWQRLREEVDAGRQGFVVCPVIGGDERDEGVAATDDAGSGGPAAGSGGPAAGAADAPPDASLDEPFDEPSPPAAAVEVAERLRGEEALGGARVELLHGRLAPEAKDAVMTDFAAGRVDVLVATTVIEVGVDVPNASVMVVLDADRFGVSQLHQLRGRIGRGAHPGLCLLVTAAAPGTPARQRLDAVAATRDGMELSRLDLELRREGDVLGAAQSGRRSSLRLLRVLQDSEEIERARQWAEDILDEDPDLHAHPALLRAIEQRVAEGEEYLDRA